MSRKVIVFGLDSATFKLIKKYSRNNRIPNLSYFINEGVTRILKSTVPPISPPAWTTFLTGINPGSHGIFHFVDFDIFSYNCTKNRLVNSSFFSGKTFVDFICNQKLKVGLVKIPFTYPPWKVNGFMVAGEPSPDWKKAYTFPIELSEKIGRVNIGSSIDFMRFNTENLLQHLLFDCKVRTRISCEMLDKDAYDFFMVVHNITDAASHRFWKFTDEGVPNYKKKFSKYSNLIQDIYSEADKSIGKIMEKVSKDTTIFIMSDHGSARKPIYFFNINCWLKEMGFIKTKKRKSTYHFLYKAVSSFKNLLPTLLRQFISRAIKIKFQNSLSKFQTLSANFDWNETRAYAVNLYNSYDGIIINQRGRQSNGIIKEGNETKQLCEDIISKLTKIRDKKNGNSIIEWARRREELYEGEYVNRIPDIIVKYYPDYRSGKSTTPPLFSNVPKSDFDFQSGDHDENGIFIAMGPNIKKGCELPPSDIVNMAPTILYAMGLPVPSYMDGCVMLDIFKTDFVSTHPVKIIEKEKSLNHETYELDHTEETEMKKQLKGLGYM
jgi:predicted AlkP superfamily phosphohydrolase/phosphomutase